MKIDATSLFEDYSVKMKKLGKKVYEKQMAGFRERKGEEINALVEEYSEVAQQEGAGRALADEFASQIFDAYEKRGKVKTSVMTELNLYMICYIFPAILLTENENAKALCDSLRDSWNKKFNEKIDYTDYNTILGGFRDKLFGIF